MFRYHRLFYALNQYSNMTKYNKDYYKILNIPSTASQADIRIAYLKLASKYHPDSKTKDEIKYQEVREAFQVLADASIKLEYDQSQSNNNSQRKQDQIHTYNQQVSEDNQKQPIQIQFLFKKENETFPFKLEIPKQKTLSKEELEKMSIYHMKKFLLFDGGFDKFFKENINYLEKGLSIVIFILKTITKKK